jgi:hypothetical protein
VDRHHARKNAPLSETSIVCSFQPSPIHWVSKQCRGEQCHAACTVYHIRQETHLRSQMRDIVGNLRIIVRADAITHCDPHTRNYNNVDKKVGFLFFWKINSFRNILLANSCGDLLTMVPVHVPAHETNVVILVSDVWGNKATNVFSHVSICMGLRRQMWVRIEIELKWA